MDVSIVTTNDILEDLVIEEDVSHEEPQVVTLEATTMDSTYMPKDACTT